MPTTINVEWLNQNSLRNYPIREDLKCLPTDSYGNLCSYNYALPKFLIVDFIITINSSFNYLPDVFVKQLTIVNGIVTLVFACRDNLANESIIAVNSFDAATHVANTSYIVTGSGVFVGAIGSVTIGDISRLSDVLPDGSYIYTAEQTAFEPRCIRPALSGVSSLSISKSTSSYESKKITGDITLVAGNNIFLDYKPELNEIWIHAKNNVGYSDECKCNEVGRSIIHAINGISTEKVTLVGDECMTITADEGTGIITISDKCSKPCCGCPELTFINNTINTLSTGVNNLNTFANSLQNKLNNFILNYLVSSR